jgi:predicted lipid-binding transport protein (Tim44 family)
MNPEIQTRAIGVFSDRDQADEALAELREAGFDDDNISVTDRREKAVEATPSRLSHADAGTGMGLLAGASIGGLGGGPPGMLGGALIGGLVGAFIELGGPEEEARSVEEESPVIDVVVAVQADDRLAEANEILRRHGARELPAQPAAVPG